MNTTALSLASLLFVCCENPAMAQGTFQNLDFESAAIVPAGLPFVQVAPALPGWMGYIGGAQVSAILYDTRALDAAAISVHDSSSSMQPIQGGYSVFLQGASPASPQQSAAIAQIGQVPQDARSLLFDFSTGSGLQVTFAGQAIPLVQVGTAPTYTIMGGDISAFAGLTGELRFTALASVGSGMLDEIQFSAQGIPEPGTTVLLSLGALLVGWRALKKKLKL